MEMAGRRMTELEKQFKEQIERSNIKQKLLTAFINTIGYLPKSITEIGDSVMITWKTDFKELIFVASKEGEFVHKISDDVEIENYDGDKLEEYREWLYG